MYPALDEAARLSAALRGKLNHLIDEVECSACSGSRFRDDAAAMRDSSGKTIDELLHATTGPAASDGQDTLEVEGQRTTRRR